MKKNTYTNHYTCQFIIEGINEEIQLELISKCKNIEFCNLENTQNEQKFYDYDWVTVIERGGFFRESRYVTYTTKIGYYEEHYDPIIITFNNLNDKTNDLLDYWYHEKHTPSNFSFKYHNRTDNPFNRKVNCYISFLTNDYISSGLWCLEDCYIEKPITSINIDGNKETTITVYYVNSNYCNLHDFPYSCKEFNNSEKLGVRD